MSGSGAEAGLEDAAPPRVWGEWGEAEEATQRRSGAASPSRLLRVADQRVGYPLNESEPESLMFIKIKRTRTRTTRVR